MLFNRSLITELVPTTTQINTTVVRLAVSSHPLDTVSPNTRVLFEFWCCGDSPERDNTMRTSALLCHFCGLKRPLGGPRNL